MSRLNWETPGSRQFEAGIDRGVLYVGDDPGVPWVGLISVKESSDGFDVKPRYLDGIKITNGHSPEEFQGTIEAFTYPLEFEPCDGTKLIAQGLRARQQRRRSFGMSYRTKVGNDIEGLDLGFKIHILYNLLASPSDKDSKTLDDVNDAGNFTWDISSRAPWVQGLMPATHYVIDSREIPALLLEEIEGILYGTAETAPRLPTAGELVFLFESFLDEDYDAGTPFTPVYETYDAGTPATAVTMTIDGGSP